MIKHSTDGLLFFDGGRELRIVAYDVSRTNAVVHADGLGLLPIHFYITFDDFLTVGKCRLALEASGRYWCRLSKDGLISASVSRLTKQALAIAVISGTDSYSTLPCPSSSRRC